MSDKKIGRDPIVPGNYHTTQSKEESAQILAVLYLTSYL